MASLPPNAPFSLAQKAKAYHIAVHPADSVLDPPESYLLVQTLLMLFTALLWTMANLFYSIRTFRDHKSAMPFHCLYANLAWDLFYWIAIASTPFERYGFGAWLVSDLVHAAITVRYEYPGQMWQAMRKICFGVCVFVFGFWILSVLNPDYQSSAIASGHLLCTAISWGSVYDIVRRKEMKGHSLEIWCARTLGTIFALLTVMWRYLNVPDNWLYVVQPWALALMIACILGDSVYLVIYLTRKMKKSKTL